MRSLGGARSFRSKVCETKQNINEMIMQERTVSIRLEGKPKSAKQPWHLLLTGIIRGACFTSRFSEMEKVDTFLVPKYINK